MRDNLKCDKNYNSGKRNSVDGGFMRALLFDDIIGNNTVYNKSIDKHKYKSQPWTKEVVFKVYCNDDLNKLPLEILKQMRSYLDNIIDNKEEIN